MPQQQQHHHHQHHALNSPSPSNGLHLDHHPAAAPSAPPPPASSSSSSSSSLLRVKRLSPNAVLPSRASALAAGYDIASAYDDVVPARGKALVKTDLSIAIPEGTYARLAPRSGLAWKHSIDVGAGVIDADYRGSVGVILFNHSDQDFTIRAGDRVAQLILEKIATPDVLEVENLDGTVRGEGGFGSTGGVSGSLNITAQTTETHSGYVKKWSLDELLVLVIAKDEDLNLYKYGGVKERNKSNMERWQWVANRCGQQGVHRTWKQCEVKWNHELPGFKKIRDFERHRPSGLSPYWELTPAERLGRGLPRTYNKEVYDVLEKHHGHHAFINRGNILVDSNVVGTREDNIPSCVGLEEDNVPSETAALEEARNLEASTSVLASAGSSTGKLKRARSQLSETMLETSKKLVDCLNNATMEHAEHFKETESSHSKRSELNRAAATNSTLQIAGALRDIGSAIQSLSSSLARTSTGV